MAKSRSKSKRTNPKTNKSFTKRLKVTRNGKIIARATDGKYKAKDSRQKQMGHKRTYEINFSSKIAAQNIPGWAGRINRS